MRLKQNKPKRLFRGRKGKERESREREREKMGEVADTLTKKRKKKGRPSLIEVQKRALKQQQLLQSKLDESKEEVRSGFGNPNSAATRSSRRIVNPSEEEEEEDDDERRDKKQRLLHGLNSHDDRRESELDGDASSINRRKIGGAGSDVTVVTELFVNIYI